MGSAAVMDIQTMLDSKVAHRWYQMGVILGVPVDQLENIRLKNDDAGDCERVMFTKFLSADRDSLRPTWQLLVDAVGHKAGGNNLGLAQNLSKKVAERFPGMFMHYWVRNWELSLWQVLQMSISIICSPISSTVPSSPA